ncbi:MAG: hypothetical protein CMH57_10655 [Myxococcales bacterium]|nr:hypothetical protein [Myxococcales bacterium]
MLLVLLVASVASALSKEELFKLKEQKVPDTVVLSVAKGSAPLNLNKNDIEKLKKLGAGDVLLDWLETNGHILADIGGNGGGGLEPAENDPDAIAAEEARRKAEEEARIKAEAEKLRQAEKEREAKQAEIQRMAAKLLEADRALDRDNNMQAAAVYLEFLALTPDPESDEFYQANCGLAKALFKEKVFSGAAVPTLDVLMKGPEKPCFTDAFYMLQTITKETGYAPPQLQQLTSFYVDNLEPKFRDDFHYYLGKYFYDYRNIDQAISFLEKVSDESPIKARAQYLTGVAQINPEVKKYRSAVQNFQKAIISAETIDDTDPEIRELGYLALARVAYEATNYDGALFYYNKIRELSPRRSTALFEASWTYFLKNDYKRAMGTFHSLHSPYFEQWYYPDIYVLEATVYLNLCKFGNAKEALAAFNEKYLDKQPILQKYLQSPRSPEEYYNTIVTIYEKLGTGEDEGLPMVFVQAVLNDADFYNSYGVINNLAREEKALQANLTGLGDFGQTVLTQVQEARTNQLLEAGIKVQQILTGLDQELTEWSIKRDEIDFEIDSARVEEAKRQLVNPDYVPPEAREGTTLFVVADDWQFWPFEGEYWIDEVANYRSFLRTECIEQ